MNGKILGSVVLVGLVVSTLAAWSNQAGAIAETKARQDSSVFAEKDGLIAVDLEGSATADQLAVIDPKVRSLAVYQIDRQTGEITLKSVRKMHWDLQLDDYNGNKPIVRDIRSTVENNLRR